MVVFVLFCLVLQPLHLFEGAVSSIDFVRIRNAFGLRSIFNASCSICLILSLIHTDAADDLLCVDLGGRRIIKKKIVELVY